MPTNKQGVILLLFSALVWSHLEFLSDPLVAGGMNILERVQRRATKRMKELKLLTCEERLRCLSHFSLEKRRLRKNLISVDKCFQRGCKDRTRLFSVMPVTSCVVIMPSDRARGNGHKLKQRMFFLEHQETVLLWGWLFTDIGCPESLWNLPLWR